MEQVLRQEYKYLITIDACKKLSHQLGELLKEDVHNGLGGYRVRSLYFDTLNNKDFVEKQNGEEVRRKIRLRRYNTQSEYALLEMKQKQGIYQLKRSLKIKREDALLLTKGIYTPLLNYKENFAAECFAMMHMECYRPKVVVQYNRKAFVAQGNETRITMDSDLVATQACFDIFSDTLQFYPVLSPFHSVIEVKYNDFLLSYIKDMLNQINRTQVSVSKYCLGRNVNLNELF